MRKARFHKDDGFSLVELLICVGLVGVLAAVTSSAIVVALRTSPAVEDRADASVNVQGLVTWLPQDVDSAAPDSFVNTAASSGCAGTDPGNNLLKLSWSETITSTTNYTVSYRYVAEPVPSVGGRIVRVYCIVGGPSQILRVSGVIPAWISGAEPVKVTLSDAPDSDTRIDTVRFEVQPIAGKNIVVIGTTKNLNQTLSAPTATTPTVTTQPVNQPPVAAPASYTITSGTPSTISVSGSDPEGLAVTAAFPSTPVGWVLTPSGALTFTVTAPASADNTTVVIPFTLTDPASASGSASVTFTVVPAGVDQPPVANASSGSTTAGSAVVVPLVASDPEGAVLTAAVSNVPSGWATSISGLSVTVTPPTTATVGTFVMTYSVAEPGGGTASSTLTIVVTGPPPCVIASPVASPSSVQLKKNDPDALTSSVTVTITIISGYCVGLALHYDTGAPNGQYVRNFATSGVTRSITLPNHPSPELWSSGTKTLQVKDSSNLVIGSVDLGVTP